MAVIKTPDQRVRVFISSTINELADERMAARKAIENLKLIPVFFEAGARPHPPRDLYSAYLSQSHIFLGIYWNSYGWIAPGAEISGLEDEYRLCEAKKPKLIYVKQSNERQEKLNMLLQDISNSESACYQKFHDAEELQQLIENDLSILMSEIFEQSLLNEQTTPPVTASATISHRLVDLPLVKADMIGRENDLVLLEQLLMKADTSLVTLLGAGGTGKTTLSMHIGQRLQDRFSDGVVFVPLAPITNPELVANTIAEKLGIQDTGKVDMITSIIEVLGDKHFLLILDNYEQVVDSSMVVSQLINHCKSLKVLITSRSSLRIRNERIYHLSTLALPEKGDAITLENLYNFSATRLFLERANEVNRGIEDTPENAEAILEICQRMDGLPLAIELAAARTRFFQPAALLSRITKTLDLVSKGHKDLPERQQTLRGAIEWSYNLLSADTQSVFRQLGLFKRSWTLEAADMILLRPELDIDTEEYTERLLDVSLIKPDILHVSAEPRFNMLQTVHEYANEMLEQDPALIETKRRFGYYFLQLCEEAEPHVWGRNGDVWLDRLEAEYQNIRAAFYIFIEQDMLEEAWRFLPCLAPYWTIRGGFSETMMLIRDAKLHEEKNWLAGKYNTDIQARALTWAGYCSLFVFDFERGFQMEEAAQLLLQDSDDLATLTYALCFDGCYGSYMQRPGSSEKIERGAALIDLLDHKVARSMFYCWSDQYYLSIGKPEVRDKNLELAWQLAKDEGITYIKGAVLLIKSTSETLLEHPDPNKLIEMGRELYEILPAKGYKGLKAAAKQFQGFGFLMQGKLDECRTILFESAELVQLSGEKEGEIYLTMFTIQYCAMSGHLEQAFIGFGALQQYIEDAQYPVVGGAAAQHKLMSSFLQPYADQPDPIKWVESGRKLTLNTAVHLALEKI